MSIRGLNDNDIPNTLPYELVPYENSDNVSFPLYEKMKYNKMSNIIGQKFIGRYVAVQFKENSFSQYAKFFKSPDISLNFFIGTIKSINKNTHNIQILFESEEKENIESLITIQSSNKSPNANYNIYLLENAFYFKKLSCVVIILSNFLTKDLMISKTSKENVIYSGFILRNFPKKITKIPINCFLNYISSTSLISLDFALSRIYQPTLTFSFKINKTYINFLLEVEYLSIPSSSLHKYILYEININQELYILLSHSERYSSSLVRKFSTNELEWKSFKDDKNKISINIMKGPITLSSIQKDDRGFWINLSYKNIKTISIYDNLNYESNIVLNKNINGVNIFSQVQCAKCQYCIGNFDFYICYSCSKVFHSNCLDENVVSSILINGAFSCEQCRPCFNCKTNTDFYDNGYGSGIRYICTKCHKAYHLECLYGNIREIYREIDKNYYKCENCIKCIQCGCDAHNILLRNPNNKFGAKCEMCIECEQKRMKKEFCPICDQLWNRQNDDNIIECKCRFFMHKKCDRLFMFNDKKKYHCPICRIKKKQKFIENVLSALINQDENKFFIDPVDIEAIPNYIKVIKKPMCFKMIEDKLKDETNFWYIKNMNEFYDDVNLITINAMIYNKPNDYIYKEAQKLKEQCEKILKDNFSLLYQLSFEYYLFDYYDTNQIKEYIHKEKESQENQLTFHNSYIEIPLENFLLDQTHKLLKEKFNQDLIHKMGTNHIQKKIFEYEIEWEFISEFGLVKFSKGTSQNICDITIEEQNIPSTSPIQIRIEDLDMSTISNSNNHNPNASNCTMNTRHKNYKANDIISELDLLSSNFEFPGKNSRQQSISLSNENIGKMEINENALSKDQIDLSLKEEDCNIMKNFDLIKQVDRRICFLYPNKFKDYSLRKNDRQSFIDFISSFIIKKENIGKANQKSKKKNSTQYLYDNNKQFNQNGINTRNSYVNYYDDEDEKNSDTSYRDNNKKKKKKTKRKISDSSSNYEIGTKSKKQAQNIEKRFPQSKKPGNTLHVHISISPKKKKETNLTIDNINDNSPSGVLNNNNKSLNDNNSKILNEESTPSPISKKAKQWQSCQICFSKFDLIFYPCCFLCGSFDESELMINCNKCKEYFHYYCISPHSHNNNNNKEKMQLDLNVIKQTKWKCSLCKVCEKCKSNTKLESILYCSICNITYHSFCLPYPFYSKCGFKCEKCFKCENCGCGEYYNAQFPLKKEKDYSIFTRNFSYCYQCGLKLFYNSLCAKCELSDFKNYNKKLFFILTKEDFISKKEFIYKTININDLEEKDSDDIIMIYCHLCKNWYHSKCLGFDYVSIDEYYNKFDTFKCLDCFLMKKYDKNYNDIAYISYLEVLKTSFKLMCLSKIIMILLKKYQMNSSVKLHTKLIKMFLKENYEMLLENKNICMLIELIKFDVYLLREKKINEEHKSESKDIKEIESIIQNDDDCEILKLQRDEIYSLGMMNEKFLSKNRRRFETEKSKRNSVSKYQSVIFDPIRQYKKTFKNKIFDQCLLNNTQDLNSLLSKINISKIKEKTRVKQYDETYFERKILKNFFKNDKVTYPNKGIFPNNIVDFYNFDLEQYFPPEKISNTNYNPFDEINDLIYILNIKSSATTNKHKITLSNYKQIIRNFIVKIIFSCITFLRTTILKWLLNQLTTDCSLLLSSPSSTISEILNDDQTQSEDELLKYLDSIDQIIPSPNIDQKCEFCNRKGARTRSGRLIYIRNNQWGHINCLYWSKGVIENYGYLQHVGSIINKISQYKCLLCKKAGATVVCHVPKCGRPFHFICALAKGCTFTYNNHIYCNRCTHSQKDNTDAVLFNNTKKLYIVDRKGEFRYNAGVFNRFGNATIMKFVNVNCKDYTIESVDLNIGKVVNEGEFAFLCLNESGCVVKRFEKTDSNIKSFEELVDKGKIANCFFKTIYDDVHSFTLDNIDNNNINNNYESNDVQMEGCDDDSEIKIPIDTSFTLNFYQNKNQRIDILENVLTVLKDKLPNILRYQYKENIKTQNVLLKYFNFPFSLYELFSNRGESYASLIVNTTLSDLSNISIQCSNESLKYNIMSTQINTEQSNKSIVLNEAMSISSSIQKTKRPIGNLNTNKSKLEQFVSLLKTKNKIQDIDDNNIKMKYTKCFKFVNYIESHKQILAGKRSANMEYVEYQQKNAGKSKGQRYSNKNLKSTNGSLMEYNLPLPMKYRNYKAQGTKVAIGPSRIHRNGLFAMDSFQPGEIVIEYVGEIISNKIADFREKEYNLRGFGDCYMFRVDQDKIIDATKFGNLARFINHSCDPNCTAQSNEINGKKHIILYAKRLIKNGEEITYDYNFESETEKIQCRCGAPNCQGRLN